MSFTSDEEDNDEEDDDDDEEDQPLAARMPIGSRPAPKRGGKAPGKKSKKSHTIARGGEVPTKGTNGHVNGINGHDVKMDDGQINRLTAGVPVDTVGRSSTAVRMLSIVFMTFLTHHISLQFARRNLQRLNYVLG